jgi:hypothetical protein
MKLIVIWEGELRQVHLTPPLIVSAPSPPRGELTNKTSISAASNSWARAQTTIEA